MPNPHKAFLGAVRKHNRILDRLIANEGSGGHMPRRMPLAKKQRLIRQLKATNKRKNATSPDFNYSVMMGTDARRVSRIPGQKKGR